jgi:hypothetical protein
VTAATDKCRDCHKNVRIIYVTASGRRCLDCEVAFNRRKFFAQNPQQRESIWQQLEREKAEREAAEDPHQRSLDDF